MINHVLKKCLIPSPLLSFFASTRQIKESDQLSQEEIDDILGNTLTVKSSSEAKQLNSKNQ